MLGSHLPRHYSEPRLQRLLLVLFGLLALPAAFLVWQGFDQLKWESWYQHRNQAETLVSTIDSNLATSLQRAEQQAFDDYSFLQSTNVERIVERSPLSSFPVQDDPPGMIGYFQVSPAGELTSPLVPTETELTDYAGIDETELAARRSLVASIREVLVDNALVRESADVRLSLPGAESTATAPASLPETNFAAENDVDLDRPAAEPGRGAYDPGAFERLNTPEALSSSAPQPVVYESSTEEQLGKVSALQLDDELEQRNIAMQQDSRSRDEDKKESADNLPLRRQAAENEAVDSGDNSARVDRITTFNSALEPYQFSLLASGHGVFYRNAWRDGDRYIQGFLLNQHLLTESAIRAPFRESSLAGMSDLIIGFQDDVIDIVRGNDYRATRAIAGDLAGTLLFRQRLSAPLDRVELVFSVNRLPRGAGATVLGWTSVAVAAVMILGFLALYRLGVSQIRLARQQQDFVSSVSHELKTPLTSIRMYGEMLKEGWVEDDKRRQYYEFIHDESERLTRLIANVLQLARFNRDELQLEIKTVGVTTLANQVESKVSHACERAGFDLDIDLSGLIGDEQIAVDEDAFAQILINLVDNAIKFSRNADRKEVAFAAMPVDQRAVRFSVRDFGPGIPKDQLRKIFDLFYRTESELTRETVGTGIGLAIVKQLTESMHGSVDVANRNPGAEFIVRFPLLNQPGN